MKTLQSLKLVNIGLPQKSQNNHAVASKKLKDIFVV
jgi:hypothetical protein